MERLLREGKNEGGTGRARGRDSDAWPATCQDTARHRGLFLSVLCSRQLQEGGSLFSDKGRKAWAGRAYCSELHL